MQVCGTEVVALLDSGANGSVIGGSGMRLIHKFGLKVSDCVEKNVVTADGMCQPVRGTVDLPFCIDNVCHVIRTLVVPSVKHSLILGSDFCRNFSIKLDYKNNTWHIQSEGGTYGFVALDNPESCVIDFDSLGVIPELQRKAAGAVINSFRALSSEDKLGHTDKISLEIDTGDTKPFKQKQYPLSPYLLKLLNAELDSMLKLKVVEPSRSPWCSPVLLVRKKSGEYRFCFDGRKLNSVTKHDSYPLPRIDRILNMLRDAKFISSIDLRKAFWQIPLDESSKEKTAFAVPGRGLFQFRVVPFGLCNSAQTQQRLMDAVFGPKYEPNIFVYLDDIIVVSSSFEHHLQLLTEVKERLSEANLTINFQKCDFFKNSLKYLGYLVDSQGLRIDPDKVAAMVSYPRPTTSTEIKRYVGMCSWYRRFIPHFSTLVAPINNLLKGKKKKQSILWNEAAEESFIKIKEALVSAPILCSPDFSQPFTIQCDASDVGLGGVLTQNIDDRERVIAFASRSLTKSERAQPIIQRECLAVIFCIEKFRPYVEGSRFTVITDCHSLTWLNNLKDPTGKLARWMLKLQQYSFDLIHRKGKLNVVPDALSRIPREAPDPELVMLDITPENFDAFYIRQKHRILKEPAKYPQWRVERDLVYKFFPSKCPLKSNISEWKLLVPKKLRVEAIMSCHDPPTSAHFGVYKTLSKLQERYYWPKMRNDVLNYINKCKVCSAQKQVRSGKVGLMGSRRNVRFPFQVIAVDFMGPFPRSSRGNKFLLVVSDWFSKMSFLHPVRQAVSSSVTKFMENSIFLMFGVPQFIVCDNGKQFVSNEFKSLARKYGVQKIQYNALYHPQCNFAERVNKTVGTAIRSYIKEHKDWDKYLPELQYALNSATHEVTGYSPFFLNFGRNVPIHGDYYGKITSGETVELVPADRSDHVEDLNRLSDVVNEVEYRLKQAYERNAEAYNLRRRHVEYNIGDKVWRRNKVLSDACNKFSAKLAPKYVLCTVKDKVSPVVYSLQDEDGVSVGNWHVQDLKPYFGSNSNISES